MSLPVRRPGAAEAGALGRGTRAQRGSRLRALPPAASRDARRRLRADRRRRRLDRRFGRDWPQQARARSRATTEPRGPASAGTRCGGRHGRPRLLPRRRRRRCIPTRWPQPLARFEAEPGLTALFGSYDDAPPAPDSSASSATCSTITSISRATSSTTSAPPQTFWTGCGAIRRRAFLDVGGFDPRLYAAPRSRISSSVIA